MQTCKSDFWGSAQAAHPRRAPASRMASAEVTTASIWAWLCPGGDARNAEQDTSQDADSTAKDAAAADAPSGSVVGGEEQEPVDEVLEIFNKVDQVTAAIGDVVQHDPLIETERRSGTCSFAYTGMFVCLCDCGHRTATAASTRRS